MGFYWIVPKGKNNVLWKNDEILENLTKYIDWLDLTLQSSWLPLATRDYGEKYTTRE